jgi:hypothetical protein
MTATATKTPYLSQPRRSACSQGGGASAATAPAERALQAEYPRGNIALTEPVNGIREASERRTTSGATMPIAATWAPPSTKAAACGY